MKVAVDTLSQVFSWFVKQCGVGKAMVVIVLLACGFFGLNAYQQNSAISNITEKLESYEASIDSNRQCCVNIHRLEGDVRKIESEQSVYLKDMADLKVSMGVVQAQLNLLIAGKLKTE